MGKYKRRLLNYDNYVTVWDKRSGLNYVSKIQGEDGCLRREQTYYTDQLG